MDSESLPADRRRVFDKYSRERIVTLLYQRTNLTSFLDRWSDEYGGFQQDRETRGYYDPAHHTVYKMALTALDRVDKELSDSVRRMYLVPCATGVEPAADHQ